MLGSSGFLSHISLVGVSLGFVTAFGFIAAFGFATAFNAAAILRFVIGLAFDVASDFVAVLGLNITTGFLSVGVFFFSVAFDGLGFAAAGFSFYNSL
ncbi:hypothetical protein U1Q18_039069 [Sarracenia purpurea var. burkii]